MQNFWVGCSKNFTFDAFSILPVAKHSEKRDLILKAASDCFARFGYAKTTLDDIGRAVRLNKASLYYYFPSKDELFMEVVLQESADFQRALTEKVVTLPTTEARVREYLIERLRYYRQVVNLHQLSAENLHRLEPRFDQLYAYVLEKEVAFLDTLLQPLYPGAPARRLATLLLTTTDAIKHQAVRAAGLFRLAELDLTAAEADVQLLIDLILRGIRAPTG